MSWTTLAPSNLHAEEPADSSSAEDCQRPRKWTIAVEPVHLETPSLQGPTMGRIARQIPGDSLLEQDLNAAIRARWAELAGFNFCVRFLTPSEGGRESLERGSIASDSRLNSMQLRRQKAEAAGAGYLMQMEVRASKGASSDYHMVTTIYDWKARTDRWAPTGRAEDTMLVELKLENAVAAAVDDFRRRGAARKGNKIIGLMYILGSTFATVGAVAGRNIMVKRYWEIVPPTQSSDYNQAYQRAVWANRFQNVVFLASGAATVHGIRLYVKW